MAAKKNPAARKAKKPSAARMKLALKLAENLEGFIPLDLGATHPRLAPLHGDVALPPSMPAFFDWTDKNILPPPEDQGAYNTCTSFAFTAAIEARHAIAFKTSIALSAGFVHACLGPGTNGNAPFDPALAAVQIQKYGIAYRSPNDYPFQISYCRTVPRYPVGPSRPLLGPNDARLAILQRGPITATMVFAPDFLHHDGKTVYRLPSPPQPLWPHYVCVVGYDDRPGRQYWIIQNSKGPGWGWKGFGIIAYGACGLLLPPDAPKPMPGSFAAYETMLAPPHLAPPNAAVA